MCPSLGIAALEEINGECPASAATHHEDDDVMVSGLEAQTDVMSCTIGAFTVTGSKGIEYDSAVDPYLTCPVGTEDKMIFACFRDEELAPGKSPFPRGRSSQNGNEVDFSSAVSIYFCDVDECFRDRSEGENGAKPLLRSVNLLLKIGILVREQKDFPKPWQAEWFKYGQIFSSSIEE